MGTYKKYRSTSLRHKYWDYCYAGYYFVTICTKNRNHFFGEIVNGEMKLSKIGYICENELLCTEEKRNNCIIDTFVVMPDHIHVVFGIIDPVETRRGVSLNNIHGKKMIYLIIKIHAAACIYRTNHQGTNHQGINHYQTNHPQINRQ